jgi:hypothetical protein
MNDADATTAEETTAEEPAHAADRSRPPQRPGRRPRALDPRDRTRDPTRHHGLLLLLALGFALLALYFNSWYTDWVLEGPAIEVAVHCHTEPLRTDDLRISVLYDKVALHPLARWTGWYQHRPPDEVHSYVPYPLEADAAEFRPYVVRLHGVPKGPIRRIQFRANGKGYHIDVSNEVGQDGVLHVRAE